MMSPSSPSASSASEDDDLSPRKRRAPSARVAAAAASAAAAAAAFGGGGGVGGGAAAGQATSPLAAAMGPSPRRLPLVNNHLPPPPPPLDGIRQFASFDVVTQATPQFARDLGEAMSRATWASKGGEPTDVAAVVPAGTAVSILEALAERLAADATVIDVSWCLLMLSKVEKSNTEREREREREDAREKADESTGKTSSGQEGKKARRKKKIGVASRKLSQNLFFSFQTFFKLENSKHRSSPRTTRGSSSSATRTDTSTMCWRCE